MEAYFNIGMSCDVIQDSIKIKQLELLNDDKKSNYYYWTKS